MARTTKPPTQTKSSKKARLSHGSKDYPPRFSCSVRCVKSGFTRHDLKSKILNMRNPVVWGERQRKAERAICELSRRSLTIDNQEESWLDDGEALNGIDPRNVVSKAKRFWVLTVKSRLKVVGRLNLLVILLHKTGKSVIIFHRVWSHFLHQM